MFQLFLGLLCCVRWKVNQINPQFDRSSPSQHITSARPYSTLSTLICSFLLFHKATTLLSATIEKEAVDRFLQLLSSCPITSSVSWCAQPPFQFPTSNSRQPPALLCIALHLARLLTIPWDQSFDSWHCAGTSSSAATCRVGDRGGNISNSDLHRIIYFSHP